MTQKVCSQKKKKHRNHPGKDKSLSGFLFGRGTAARHGLHQRAVGVSVGEIGAAVNRGVGVALIGAMRIPRRCALTPTPLCRSGCCVIAHISPHRVASQLQPYRLPAWVYVSEAPHHGAHRLVGQRASSEPERETITRARCEQNISPLTMKWTAAV